MVLHARPTSHEGYAGTGHMSSRTCMPCVLSLPSKTLSMSLSREAAANAPGNTRNRSFLGASATATGASLGCRPNSSANDGCVAASTHTKWSGCFALDPASVRASPRCRSKAADAGSSNTTMHRPALSMHSRRKAVLFATSVMVPDPVPRPSGGAVVSLPALRVHGFHGSHIKLQGCCRVSTSSATQRGYSNQRHQLSAWACCPCPWYVCLYSVVSPMVFAGICYILLQAPSALNAHVRNNDAGAHLTSMYISETIDRNWCI